MAREAGIYHAFDSEGHWDGLTDVKLINRNSHPDDIVYGDKRIVEILKAFEALVRADEREANSKARAGKPRQLPRRGMGMLHGEQQYCFEMGWKEGAASVRAAIRARGNT